MKTKTSRRRKQQATQSEVARELGVSRSAVSLEEKRALAKIRQLLDAGMTPDEVMALIRVL